MYTSEVNSRYFLCLWSVQVYVRLSIKLSCLDFCNAAKETNFQWFERIYLMVTVRTAISGSIFTLKWRCYSLNYNVNSPWSTIISNVNVVCTLSKRFQFYLYLFIYYWTGLFRKISRTINTTLLMMLWNVPN